MPKIPFGRITADVSKPRNPRFQVRGHTWRNVIVEARREFFVNKLRLEAFETEERQARRWSAAMTRDVVQHLTMLNAQEVSDRALCRSVC